MRIGELLNLELDALQRLHDEQWAIKVPLGKLHSERYIPVDPSTVKIYEEIRRLRGLPPPFPHPETGKPTHFLLLWPDGRRPHRNGLYNVLKRAAKRARLSEKVWPHRLRHTFATEMLRAGMSLPVLMKILGHRAVGMTLRYVEVTQSDTRLAYLQSLERVKARYDFPELPSAAANPEQTNGSNLIGPQLLRIATEVEGYRRDHAQGAQRKKLQRLVERLRKLVKDLENLGA
jgi:integrase